MKRSATKPVSRATNPIPTNMMIIATTRPALVLGTMSPYPTVVTVSTANHTPSQAVSPLPSIAANDVPPARMMIPTTRVAYRMPSSDRIRRSACARNNGSTRNTRRNRAH